jgi:hypothetical protein
MIPQEAQALIEKLELIPHPEGGFYRETYRSKQNVDDRSVMTAIYFLICSQNISRFHRIKSDEMWFYHAGSALEVHTLSKENGHQIHKVGNDFEKGETPQLLVPANTIFGSTLEGEKNYSLVSCTVAPGFDFADFELFTENDLLPDFPEYDAVIRKMT